MPSFHPRRFVIAAVTGALRPRLHAAPSPLAIASACCLAACAVPAALAQVQVTTSAQLIDAVNNGPAGSTILVAAGTYELPAPLQVKSGVSIIGAGMGQTIIRNAPSFSFPPQPWYGDDTNIDFCRPEGYLLDLGRDRSNITIRDLTLTGPQVFGGIHVIVLQNLTITGVEFRDFLWSGIRGYGVPFATITNNRFVDAGGQTVGSDGSFGVTGGSMFIAYMGDSVIANNRFERSGTRADNVFGIKGREFRRVAIRDNTIFTDFAIELPFENDHYVDIERNYLDGVVSIPRYAGGTLPTGPNPYAFRIRNNYFTKSYAIEGPHNGLYIEDNVFNFPVTSDYGNLMSTFDPASSGPLAPGPMVFSGNIVINPGRGVFWSDLVWNNLTFTNNHIFCDEVIPSQDPEGLFSFRDFSPGFGGEFTDFSTITVSNNVVEIIGQSRNFIRWPSGYAANIANNRLLNVTDAGAPAMPNPNTGAPKGLLAPLLFRVGVQGEFLIDGSALLRAAGATTFCDALDFNGDTLFPDDADLIDFLTVLSGGNCSPSNTCNDIDFNNDGLFPDDTDLIAFLTVLAGGAC